MTQRLRPPSISARCGHRSPRIHTGRPTASQADLPLQAKRALPHGASSLCACLCRDGSRFDWGSGTEFSRPACWTLGLRDCLEILATILFAVAYGAVVLAVWSAPSECEPAISKVFRAVCEPLIRCERDRSCRPCERSTIKSANSDWSSLVWRFLREGLLHFSISSTAKKSRKRLMPQLCCVLLLIRFSVRLWLHELPGVSLAYCKKSVPSASMRAVLMHLFVNWHVKRYYAMIASWRAKSDITDLGPHPCFQRDYSQISSF